MQRKIFIAVNLPQAVKKRLYQKTEKWRDSPPHQKIKVNTLSKNQTNFWCGGLPVKWTSEDNLHIALVFLGYLEDEKIPGACLAVRQASENFQSFEISLNKIILGPNANQAKMIWTVGDKSDELKKLQEEIEKELGIFVREKKEFHPHVNMGRIRHEKWIELPENPIINEKINFVIPVESVEILESITENGKRKYLLLEDCPLA